MTQPLVSIVVPCFNESAVFPLLQEALVGLAGQLESRGLRVQLVLVDDGSSDDTWTQLQSFGREDPRVLGVALSRNFGHQSALTCGYELAEGDGIVCMDADLQDPPEVVLQLVEEWQRGADVVYAVREERDGETWFKLATARAFYWLIRTLGADRVRSNTGDFRLLSRRALDAFLRLREHHRFIRGMVGWVGFETAEVRYHRRARAAGETKYPFTKMVRFALDAIVSFSSTPLRLTFALSFGSGGIVLAYLLYAVIAYVFFDATLVTGWTSLICAAAIFGSLNLFCLGILGEYVGRLYEQSKDRPIYLVKGRTDGALAPPYPNQERPAT